MSDPEAPPARPYFQEEKQAPAMDEEVEAAEAVASGEGAGAGGAEEKGAATLDSILTAAEKTEISAGDTVFPEGVDAQDERLAYEENRLSDEEMLKAVNLDVDIAAQLAADYDFTERTKYIPLRLGYKERKYLRLIESALNVSEYTDKVDVVGWGLRSSRGTRIHTQVKDICAILTGLMVAHDYARGQRLLKKREFAENAKYFQSVFELARRYKTLNPERMRSSYGKLLYLLQDCRIPQITDLVGFDPVIPIYTVHSWLEARDGLAMLQDRLMFVATQEIADDKSKTRAQIQEMIRQKNSARKYLQRKYASRAISADDIELCLSSISDNASFLLGNRDPVDKILAMLTEKFDPQEVPSPQQSLGIIYGSSGARLSHSHSRQYAYVFQTFTLWRTILNDFYKLWFCAEADLLDPDSMYRLRDTGQGLNRVQDAPRVRDAMARILSKVRTQMGYWVGSSVVHLGDHNVPNAFIFLDKYTQVSRILNPIVKVLETIGKECEKDDGIRGYVEATFGGVEEARMEILVDFLRHGFDGSGSDNFFDAGSCIDGRLTSAWNWCSKIEKKRYYPLFLLCRFSGFDGDSKEG